MRKRSERPSSRSVNVPVWVRLGVSSRYGGVLSRRSAIWYAWMTVLAAPAALLMSTYVFGRPTFLALFFAVAVNPLRFMEVARHSLARSGKAWGGGSPAHWIAANLVAVSEFSCRPCTMLIRPDQIVELSAKFAAANHSVSSPASRVTTS
jgi:hypothetical protein